MAEADNLLDEAISIERDGVLVFEEKPGMAISASASTTGANTVPLS